MLLEACVSTNWSAPAVSLSLSKTTIRHHRLLRHQLRLTLSSLSKHPVLLKQHLSRRRIRPTLKAAGAKLTTTCLASSTTRACSSAMFSIRPAVHAPIFTLLMSRAPLMSRLISSFSILILTSSKVAGLLLPRTMNVVSVVIFLVSSSFLRFCYSHHAMIAARREGITHATLLEQLLDLKRH